MVERRHLDTHPQSRPRLDGDRLRRDAGIAPAVVNEPHCARIGEAHAQEIPGAGAAGDDHGIGAAGLAGLEREIEGEWVGENGVAFPGAPSGEREEERRGGGAANQKAFHACPAGSATAVERSAVWRRASCISVGSVGSGRATMNIW